MNCQEAERQIMPYIRGTISERDVFPFIHHVRTCEACHEELEIQFIVDRAMQYFEDEEHSSYDLTGLLEEDLRWMEEHARRRRLARRILYLLLLLLAVLAVLFGLSYFDVITLPWAGGWL